jgi:hypothetical protein
MSDIDTNSPVKYANLFASPTQYQTILGTDSVCPVYYCNYKKAADENKRIFQRNIPRTHRPLSVPHRSGYMVCKKHIDLNKSETTRYIKPTFKKSVAENSVKSGRENFTSNYHNTNRKVDNYDVQLLDDFYNKHANDIITRRTRDGTFISNDPQEKWNYMNRRWAEEQLEIINNHSDNMETSGWANEDKDIDIDSNLRQGFLHSECPDKRYKPELCDTLHVNTAEILDDPYCQNYKVYDFNDYTQPYCPSGKAVSKNTRKMYRGAGDTTDESILEFNYNNNNPTCISSKLKSKKHLSNLKQPVLFQENHNMVHGKSLSVGPERTDHKYENIWNNTTKRRLI